MIKQIHRIREKLLIASEADRSREVFGASSHKYKLNPPVKPEQIGSFEEKYQLVLPNCYKSFLLELGNGGAGPFYGIYPLGHAIDELVYGETGLGEVLRAECAITPRMTQEFWDDVCEKSQEASYYAGLLPIGTQGCSYSHALILNGEYRGRVVNVDQDLGAPRMTFEPTFLDWYERWLDEVISGDLMQDGPTPWFGYTMGGREEHILEIYYAADDFTTKEDCLHGLLSKRQLNVQTLDTLEVIYNESTTQAKSLITQIFTKCDYSVAKPYLIELAESNLCKLFQLVYLYQKNHAIEWLPLVESRIKEINDPETFRFCTYLLGVMNIDYGDLLAPFSSSPNEQIRVALYYSLGKLPNKQKYLSVFINGLEDGKNSVVRQTLQALAGVHEKKLLPFYKNLAEVYTTDKDYIRSNLIHRLKEFGYDLSSIVNARLE